MGAAPALDYTYRYPFASEVGEDRRGFGLRLATCDQRQASGHFFEGRLLHARDVGNMLLAVSEVVRTHYFLPRPPLLDPVVTSSEEVLRFEGFSGCCGVYVRVDLPAASFESELQLRGTTNVDFNSPMRAALTRLRDRDEARLSVGADAVTLASGSDRVVEKKVKLPVRWVKGFSEVQVYQPGLRLAYEVSGAEARRFIRSLPRSSPPKRPMFVEQLARSLRLSQRERPGSVRLCGTHRLRALDSVAGSVKSLRIWSDPGAGTSGWEAVLDAGRVFLMLSPEVYRGFSGEGQALEALSGERWAAALPHVQAQLCWQSKLDASALAEETGLEPEDVLAALAVLGSRGLAGFDVSAGTFFHRELPFDLESVERLQPRLKNARKLIEEGRVRVIGRVAEGEFDLEVGGTGVQHHVRIRAEGARCTCPWFSKYLGQRGPCKHILAAQMTAEAEQEDATGEMGAVGT